MVLLPFLVIPAARVRRAATAVRRVASGADDAIEAGPLG